SHTPLTLLLAFSFRSFQHPATTQTYPLSLHDALPIFRIALFSYTRCQLVLVASSALVGNAPLTLVSVHFTPRGCRMNTRRLMRRSEEHTSELQSRENLVCRLLLEKKKKTRHILSIAVR